MEQTSLLEPVARSSRRKLSLALAAVFVVGVAVGIIGVVAAGSKSGSAAATQSQTVPFTNIVEPDLVPRTQFQEGPQIAAQPFTGQEIIVDTEDGQLRGAVVDDAGIRTRQFLGIPFAKPPTGALRFAHPQPPTPWKPAVRDALHPGLACPQLPHAPGSDPTSFKFPIYSSEDCLYLNVIAPDDNSKGKPVLVYFHGGTFLWGAGGQQLYFGDKWVGTDKFVLVTVNYRLGVFGGLYLGESDGANQIRDQRLALQWVKANIHAFGGNPNAVTIAGNSAGGFSVAVHQASPLSKGLFHRAIFQSSPFHRLQTPARATDIANRVLKNTTCDQYPDHLACLRSLPPVALLVAEWVATPTLDMVGHDSWNFWDMLEIYAPVVGPALDIPTDQIFHYLLDAKNWNVKHVMLGNVKEESQGYFYAYEAQNPALFAPNAYLTGMVLMFGLNTGFATAALYPLPHGATSWAPTATKIMNDLWYCATARQSLAQGGTTYYYHYNHANSFRGFDDLTHCFGHVCHASELEILFGTVERAGRVYTDDEKKLVRAMQQSWSSFLRSGVPKSEKFTWPSYNIITRKTVELDWPLRVESHLGGHNCAFWDLTGYQWMNAGSAGAASLRMIASE